MSLSCSPRLARLRRSLSNEETLYWRLVVDITSEGVGDSGAGDPIDGCAWSWLESCGEDDSPLAARAALARVVTIASPRESFENCSADMKVLGLGVHSCNQRPVKGLYNN